MAWSAFKSLFLSAFVALALLFSVAFAFPTSSAREQCPVERRCTDRDLKFRAVDGSCNNLGRPSEGQSFVPFSRLVPAKHTKIDCGPPRFAPKHLPNSRQLSLDLVKRAETPASRKFSAMLWNFGQYMDHDLMLTPPRETSDGKVLDCCEPEHRDHPNCCPILTPNDDSFYGKDGRPRCIPFLLSKLATSPGDKKRDCRLRRKDPQNINTAWIDGSVVYGSDDKKARSLRAFRGGLLTTERDHLNREWAEIIPREGTSDPDDLQFRCGDDRADVTPGQSLISMAFVRNHNKLARKLARLQPSWDDERLYQESRKINIAQLQHITYTQFMDALLGTPNDVSLTGREGRHVDEYDPNAHGGVYMGFGTAGFRLHTYIGGHMFMRDRNFKLSGRLRLRDIFNKPRMVLEGEVCDALCRGLSAQGLSDFDNVFSAEMTEWLFPESEDSNFGFDIAAINIQRGRDHRLPTYPTYKKFCRLGKARTWDEMTDLIPPNLVHRLVHSYQSVDDVDMYVAGNMEEPVVGSILGPTFHCLVRIQFEMLRKADRFFYTNPGQFTKRQLATIGRTTLSSILCENSDEPKTQRLAANVFELPDSVSNPVVSCSNSRVHPRLDMSAWK